MKFIWSPLCKNLSLVENPESSPFVNPNSQTFPEEHNLPWTSVQGDVAVFFMGSLFESLKRLLLKICSNILLYPNWSYVSDLHF